MFSRNDNYELPYETEIDQVLPIAFKVLSIQACDIDELSIDQFNFIMLFIKFLCKHVFMKSNNQLHFKNQISKINYSLDHTLLSNFIHKTLYDKFVATLNKGQKMYLQSIFEASV